MTDDFDILRTAWGADLSSETEIAASQRLWKRAVWKTRAWNVAESVTLLILSVYLATWMLGNAPWASAALAATMVALLWWSQRKRYRLRSEELSAGSPERVTLLGREQGRVRARLLRNGLAIGLIVPLFAFGFVMARLERVPAPRRPSTDWLHAPAIKWLALALLVYVLVRLIGTWLQDHRASKYLAELAEEYQAEYRRDQQDAP